MKEGPICDKLGGLDDCPERHSRPMDASSCKLWAMTGNESMTTVLMSDVVRESETPEDVDK